MEDLEIKVNRKQVFKESTEQLSHLYAKNFATKDEIENAEYIFTKDIDLNSCGGSGAEPISIAELRTIIDKAEKAGANFITIDYHIDHGEYDIYGYHCVRPSEKEVEEYEAKLAKVRKEAKEAKIKYLQEQIEKLKALKFIDDKPIKEILKIMKISQKKYYEYINS